MAYVRIKKLLKKGKTTKNIITGLNFCEERTIEKAKGTAKNKQMSVVFNDNNKLFVST